MQREYMYELLAKMKEGNRQAFHAFYDATYQDVYRSVCTTIRWRKSRSCRRVQSSPDTMRALRRCENTYGISPRKGWNSSMLMERKIREHLQQKAETMECPPTISRRIEQSYSHYLQQNGHDRFVDRKRSHPIS